MIFLSLCKIFWPQNIQPCGEDDKLTVCHVLPCPPASREGRSLLILLDTGARRRSNISKCINMFLVWCFMLIFADFVWVFVENLIRMAVIESLYLLKICNLLQESCDYGIRKDTTNIWYYSFARIVFVKTKWLQSDDLTKSSGAWNIWSNGGPDGVLCS